ncbi:hypothetical protein LEP1GSC068_0477 [Leptospira sp. Fiocruz LV3954]|nr:hypothetical protein LEP1GSC068_0477 [Leptospira sp. Fiocruz LV3954]
MIFKIDLLFRKTKKKYLKNNIPDFELEFFDLSKVDLNRLESITLRVILGVVQKIWEGDTSFLVHLEKVFSLLGSLKNESKRVEILQKLFLYIFSVRELKPTEISKVLSHSRINRDYEDLTMTTAERLKKEGKIEDARNMLKEGFELDVVLRITGLTEQELKDHGVI